MIVRQGDFYGPTVNLAARLVASAEPGTALTDAGLHARLARVARRLRLRTRRPLPVRRLRRAARGLPAHPLTHPYCELGVSQRRTVLRRTPVGVRVGVCRSPRGGGRPSPRTARRGRRAGRRPTARGHALVFDGRPGRVRLRCGTRGRRGRPSSRSTADTSAPSTRSAAPVAGRVGCSAPAAGPLERHQHGVGGRVAVGRAPVTPVEQHRVLRTLRRRASARR